MGGFVRVFETFRLLVNFLFADPDRKEPCVRGSFLFLCVKLRCGLAFYGVC